jgi:hypothetical protein
MTPSLKPQSPHPISSALVIDGSALMAAPTESSHARACAGLSTWWMWSPAGTSCVMPGLWWALTGSGGEGQDHEP